MGQKLVTCAAHDGASPPLSLTSCASLDSGAHPRRPALSNLSVNARSGDPHSVAGKATTRPLHSVGRKIRRFASRRPGLSRGENPGLGEGEETCPSPEKYVSSNLNAARTR